MTPPDRWNRKGATFFSTLLGSEVGSKIGMSAEQLEDIYRETIQLSGDRIIEGTELYPLRSTPVGEDIDVTIRHNNDVTRFEGETYVLLEKVILDKLTAVQRSRWLKLQGKPDPEVTRAAKMKRILSGHGDR